MTNVDEELSFGIYETHQVESLKINPAKSRFRFDSDFRFQLFFSIIGSVVFASIINYWIMIGVAPMLFMSIWLRKYYIGVSRDIKRLEGTSMNRASIQYK